MEIGFIIEIGSLVIVGTSVGKDTGVGAALHRTVKIIKTAMSTKIVGRPKAGFVI
jgi:hypothetical protein